MAGWSTRITSASGAAWASSRRLRGPWAFVARRRKCRTPSSGCCANSTSSAYPERICGDFSRATRTSKFVDGWPGNSSLQLNATRRLAPCRWESRASMSLLPIFVKLRDRLVVVVGGGAIAEGKIDGLFAAEARVRVVAPQVTPAIARWIAQGKVEWRGKAFAPADLDGAYLVIAATSAVGVNEAVFSEADARGILCNAVDDIEHCHFYYGSVVQRGDLQIAISTNGKSPALAQRLRLQLEKQFGPEYEVWLEWLGAARELLRAGVGSTDSKKVLLHHLASQPMFERFLQEARRQRTGRGAA